MKRFLLYILLLVLPLFLILSFPLYFLYISGELMPFNTYIYKLEKGQLWGLAYSYYDREYKFYMTEELKPDIIELGTSRSMQVEDNIFNHKYTFYNAGGAVQDVQDYQTFVNKLSYNPSMIIIDINQFFFNPNSDKTPAVTYEKPQRTAASVVENCFKFYSDLFEGKIDLGKLSDSKKIGISAIMNDDGFTSTGFRNYGSIMAHPEKASDYCFRNTLERIKNHNARFQPSDSLDKSAIAYIDEFLRECKKRKIIVIAFLPPFAHLTNLAMEKDGNYKYLNQIHSSLLPYFDGKTQFLYDFTDVNDLGASDENFIDGFHAGVIADNIFFKDIITRNSSIGGFFVSKDQLDSIESAYKTNHQKFHNFNNR